MSRRETQLRRAKAGYDARSVWCFYLHRLIVGQASWPWGRLFGGGRGFGVRDNVVDIVRDTITRHSSILGALSGLLVVIKLG